MFMILRCQPIDDGIGFGNTSQKVEMYSVPFLHVIKEYVTFFVLVHY